MTRTRSRRTPLRRALVGLAALALLAAGCDAGGGAETDVEIVSATWQQNKAIPDFDSTPGETTDAAELDRLEEILETYDLAGRDVEDGDGCPGSLVTHLEYVTDTGEAYTIIAGGCDVSDAGEAIGILVSGWRTNR